MVNNRVLILTGGNIEIDFLKEWLTFTHYDCIIAVDKGLATADALALTMDYIVGDFDSVSQDILLKYQESNVKIQRHKPEKDQSDTQLAIELALDLSPSRLDVFGATGSRLDHVMANIHLLLQAMERDIPAYIIDPYNKIYIKQRSFSVAKEEQHGSFLSFLPLLGSVKGLKLEGVKYPLDGVELLCGTSLCVSNEIVDEKAKIEFEQGVLLVFESKD